MPEKYKDKVEDVGGSFIDYHKRFLDCYCLITLISKQKQPQYYGRKVTSSYNYVRGYNLKCLIESFDLHIPRGALNVKKLQLRSQSSKAYHLYSKCLFQFKTRSIYSIVH